MQWQIELPQRGTYPPLIFVRHVAPHGYHIGLHLPYHARVHEHVHRDHGRECVPHGQADFHFDARAKPFSQDYATIFIVLRLRQIQLFLL
jgi:hypothetical protein